MTRLLNDPVYTRTPRIRVLGQRITRYGAFYCYSSRYSRIKGPAMRLKARVVRGTGWAAMHLRRIHDKTMPQA